MTSASPVWPVPAAPAPVAAPDSPSLVAADAPPARVAISTLERFAVALLLAVAAVVRLLWLNREGFANTYYAATVQAMLSNWRNFFFASFDGGGFVSVDKPPLGFWVQAASAKLLGFSGVSLLLPQAIAGIVCVAVLWWLVRESYGPVAGWVAGLALALTPVTVVVDRNNTPDALLTLTMLGAVWAASRAAATGRGRWLSLATVFLGLGFNIKMLQAWLVLPAVLLVWLLTAPVSWRTRVGHALISGVVLLVTSLAWALAVDLTPGNARPFVGSSGTNSALSLALGYNGLGRLAKFVGVELGTVNLFGLSLDLAEAPGFAPTIGDPGWNRLLRLGLADQVSWLLPLAAIGLLVAGWQCWRARPLTATGRRQMQALILWGGWLVTAAGFFTTASFFHTYYLVSLAPPVAALTGISVVALSAAWRRGGWGMALAPLALVLTVGAQVVFLAPFADWRGWLAPLIGACALAAVLLLVAARSRPRLLTGALVLALVAVLAVPAVWSGVSVANGAGGGWIPSAGPGGRFMMGGPPPGMSGGRGGAMGNGASFAGGNSAPGANGSGNRAGAPTGNGGGPGTTTSHGSGDAPGGLAPIGSGNALAGRSAAPDGTENSGHPGTMSPNSPGAASAPVPNGARGAAGDDATGGSESAGGARGGFGGGRFLLTYSGANWNPLPATLTDFLIANRGDAQYLAATETSTYASVLMLATGQPVMALGGYQGWDKVIDLDQLQTGIANDTVRYFLFTEDGSLGKQPTTGHGSENDDLTDWVRASCTPVPASDWQGNTGDTLGLVLYDCGAAVN